MDDKLDSHASIQMWTSWKAGHFYFSSGIVTVTSMVMRIAGADGPSYWTLLRI